MLEQFIGEEVKIIRKQDNNNKEEGILLDINKDLEIIILKDDGNICKRKISESGDIMYHVQLYIKNHKNIRNKILNIPKPKKVTRAELIDLED